MELKLHTVPRPRAALKKLLACALAARDRVSGMATW